MTNVCIYIRYSSTEQGDNSPERQESFLKKAIKDSAADYDLTIEKMKEVDSEDGD